MSFDPLPRRIGAPTYDHVLRYTIFLRVPKGGKDVVTSLDWNLVGFSPSDRDDNGYGTPIKAPSDADALIAELLASPTVTSDGRLPPAEEGLLDFSTWSNALVVFRLFGNMWQAAPPAITTKTPQAAPGYVEATGYELRPNGKLRRIDVYGSSAGRSFPAMGFEVSADMALHTTGVNFHVQFVESRLQQVLPVIIDPDGTNGGPPGK